MARIGGCGRALRLVLAGGLLAVATLFWFAGAAHANCAIDPSDPMCMPSGGGGGITNPTSPPATSPPETAPPVNREPQGTPQETPTNPRSGFTPGGGTEYTPPVPQGTDFQTPAAVPADTPSITTNGQAPPTGGGIAATSPPPTGCDSVMPQVPLLGWILNLFGQVPPQYKQCDGTGSSLPTDGLALGLTGGAVAVAATGDGDGDDTKAAEAFKSSAAAACAQQRQAQADAAKANADAQQAQSQLDAANQKAAARNAYIDNEGRSMLQNMRYQKFGVGLGGTAAGGFVTATPEAIATALVGGSTPAGWVVMGVGAAGAALATLGVAGIANAPSLDQIDAAIDALHNKVNADLASETSQAQDALNRANIAKGKAQADAAAAADRVNGFENLLKNHQPPIPYTPCDAGAQQ